MPDAALTAPGLYGKLPATGDFVTRRLPAALVRNWDRWISRHLAPSLAAEGDGLPGIRTLVDDASLGRMAAVVLPSRDRACRRFPLTIAVPLARVDIDLAARAAPWFDAAEDAARAAIEAGDDADALAARLLALPFPAAGDPGRPVSGMVMWTASAAPVAVDPANPGPALERLFALRREAVG